jgi:hypothetical protein
MTRRVPALDDIAFDRLTRLFSASRSRRKAARTVIGTLFASTLLGQNGDVAAESGKGSGRAHGDNQPHRRNRGGEDRVGAEAQRGRSGKKGKGKRKGDGKGKRKDACTKAGNPPKRGKPCCKGLILDGTGQCAAEPTAGCRPRTCTDLGTACGPVRDGCGGMLNCGCGSGEVCCDGSCVTGVCCVNTQCGLSGDTCTNNECFCGVDPRCLDNKPTCCPLGGCANLVTDPKNCGECDFPCSDSEECCDGTCANIKSDDVLNCGECGNRCADGESCVEGVCKCGTSETQCELHQTCVGNTCVECAAGKGVCGGICQTCPGPPRQATTDGFCCDPDSPESFCSCNGECCKDQCFYEGSLRDPTGEFCCTPPHGYVCKNPDAPEDPTQDLCCEDEKCSCFNQSGRFGSNRRPGR